MKTLYELINEYLAGRVKTRLYGIYIFWIAIFHAPVIFTALFVSQELIFEKYQMLKGEYIQAHYFDLSNVCFWVYEVVAIGLSAFLTWLMIWVLPKTLIKNAYDQESTDEYDRRETKLKKQLKLQQLKEDIAQARLNEVAKEESAVNKKDKLESRETDEWNDEYQQFHSTSMFELFHQVIVSLAQQGGKTIAHDYNGRTEFEMNDALKTYMYANGLLEFVDPEKNAFDLTAKGKYFLRKYQQEYKS
ncbi:MAG TPA: hypothetical protein PKV96_00350 [Candidatus Saccharimonas sp.]|nr:hypothetical protein [Candidatus Saccharimonas sp.]